MISLPLFRTTLKSNAVIWLIFAGILAMYFSIIISMYNPDMADSMDALVAMLPPQLVEAMNFKTVDASLTGFLAGYFYGFLILLFPLVYTVIMADRMIARHVDRGSMAFLLATPNSRVKIALTQALFLAASVLGLVVVVALVGIVGSQALFPGALDISRFLALNVGAALLYLALSGIGFFASALFNQSKHSLALGGGLPGAFLMLELLSGVGEELAGLRYFSLLALFDPGAILAGESGVGLSFAVLAAIGLALYAGGVAVFNRKDLPV